MITGLDHMAMAVRDLASASRDYQAMFGRAPSWTGQVDGADHVWFQFPHMALDLVSPVGPGDQGAAVQAHLDASGEGLMAMGFRVDDPWDRALPAEGEMAAYDPVAGRLVTLENSAAERAAHAGWRRQREETWTTLFPDSQSRLAVGTDENRLDALVRFFHARMRSGGRH